MPDGFGVVPSQIAEGAAALVKAEPDVIVCGPELYAKSLRQQTQVIPILSVSEDLVGEGLATSLSHPGGNVSGISILSPELDGKRQGLLIEAVPRAKQMAALADRSLTPRHFDEVQSAAKERGIKLAMVAAGTVDEIMPALDAAKSQGAEAINVLASPLFFFNPKQTIEHMIAMRMPAIYQWPEQAEAGALIAYGPRLTEIYRQRARMIVKILRGAKIADVPIEQSTTFELVVNLKTAKAIGYKIPESLVLRADKIIE